MPATSGAPSTSTSTKPLWPWIKDCIKEKAVRRPKAAAKGNSDQSLFTVCSPVGCYCAPSTMSLQNKLISDVLTSFRLEGKPYKHSRQKLYKIHLK